MVVTVAYALANAPTADTPAEFPCPAAETVTLAVSNAAVLAAFGAGWPAPVYGPEEFLIPGVHGQDRPCDAIRYRSAKPGAPARLSITARTRDG